jgi:dihydroflavonol-4-reductase
MTGRLLVTGAGGFIGGHVARLAQAAGWQVTALDLAFPHPPAGARLVTGSILAPEVLAEALLGASAVVHGAALTDLWRRDPADYARVNREGSRRVAEAAKAAGVRLVHISSYTVLVSRGPHARPLDETVERDPAELLGPYPAAKRAAELDLLDLVARGLDARIVLPSAPIGAGDHHRTPPTRLIADLAAGRLPALLDAPMNLVDVEAVAAATLAALERGPAGRRYLLSGDDAPLSRIARLVATQAGVRPPRGRVPVALALGVAHVEAFLGAWFGRVPAAPLTGVRLAAAAPAFSNARARNELGFAPPPLEAALARAVAALQE